VVLDQHGLGLLRVPVCIEPSRALGHEPDCHQDDARGDELDQGRDFPGPVRVDEAGAIRGPRTRCLREG
jgi:hypothetical protein